MPTSVEDVTDSGHRDEAELKEAMQRAGVVGMPRIDNFEEVESVQY